MNLVVTDTGPLLHLHQAGALELLTHLGTVHVTPIVWRELQLHEPAFQSSAPPSWLTLGQPSSTAVQRAAQWVSAQVLHVGEAEALAFAQEIKADLFLTDDTAARTFGESMGLQVRGSLGVVLFAAASGHVDKSGALRVLSDLELHSTLWMSAKVKAAARNALLLLFGKP